MTYPVRWELVLPGLSETFQGEMLTLPPNGTIPTSIHPPQAWYSSWAIGLIKDESRDGLLILRFQPTRDVDDPNLPTKTIPVQIKLRYLPEPRRKILGLLLILILLALGGTCSLFLNFGIPNKLRQINLNEKLKDKKMETKIILQIHDELLFEVPNNEIEEAEKLIKREMESVVEWEIPFEISLRKGKNWAESSK